MAAVSGLHEMSVRPSRLRARVMCRGLAALLIQRLSALVHARPAVPVAIRHHHRVLLGELVSALAVRLPVVHMAALRHHVASIVAFVADEQVLRSYAARIVAAVQDAMADAQCAVGQLPRFAGCDHVTSGIEAEQPVPLRAKSAHPDPAVIRLLDERPERSGAVASLAFVAIALRRAVLACLGGFRQELCTAFRANNSLERHTEFYPWNRDPKATEAYAVQFCQRALALGGRGCGSASWRLQ